jgi:hypothetical protein
MENKTMTNDLITAIDRAAAKATWPVKRIKRITSHVGLSRYMDTLDTTMLVTPRIAAIPSPYAYSPTHTIYQVKGANPRHVIIVETKHKQYDVFDASNLPLQLEEVE